jgi:phage tail sheath gpL-like
MATHTTVIILTHRDDQIPPQDRLTLDPQLYMQDLAQFCEGVGSGALSSVVSVYRDNGDAEAADGAISVSGASHGTAATGSYALSGVGGTAATGTITFSSSTGAWTATVNGVVFSGTSAGDDDAEGDELAGLINESVNVAVAGIVTAVNAAGVVTITAVAKGTAGNAHTLAVTGTGLARSAATLSGGAQGAVTVVINGTSVGPVSTTNLTDTASATAVAAAIEANGTLGPLLAAVGSTSNVSLTWGTRGTVGNAVTLAAGTSATGTATRSGATLSGGANTSVLVTINGVGLTVTTTTTTTDAEVAEAIKTAINGSGDALIDGVVTAARADTDVDLLADTPGAAGNMITLAVSGTGLTASGNRLTGGTAASANTVSL